MALGQEGRCDIFKAQWLDTEEGAESELFIARMGAEEKDVHCSHFLLWAAHRLDAPFPDSSNFSSGIARIFSGCCTCPAEFCSLSIETLDTL
jgi:hypothetical protein